MELILAVDLMGGCVVHGRRGERASYKPLTWGLASTAEPVQYISEIRPRHLYIADLDSIMGTGSHEQQIREMALLADHCYLDQGCRSPGDCSIGNGVIPVVGTETAGGDLGLYTGGYLSIDIRDGVVIPSGQDPIQVLTAARDWAFEGCIILNITAVGTESGPSGSLEEMRSAFAGRLLYGGGIRGIPDLEILADAGYDGAIVATAIHTGHIPLEALRRGSMC
jgi:phosphoribosylformimino-5-aminoimidazole carboxamide ribotide isomerase